MFDAILGEEVKKSKPAPLKKPDAITAAPSKMRVQPAPSPPPPMPEIEKPPQSKKEPVEKKKEAPAPVQPKSDAAAPKETPKPVLNVAALEKELSDACKDMESKVKSAIEASKVSVEATRHHMALVRSIMDGSSKGNLKHSKRITHKM